MRQPVFNNCAGLRSVVGGTPRANQNLRNVEVETKRNHKKILLKCHKILSSSAAGSKSLLTSTQRVHIQLPAVVQTMTAAGTRGTMSRNVAWNHQLMQKQENHCMRCSNAQASRQRLTALSVVSGKEPLGSLKIRQNPFSSFLTHSKHQKRPFT